MGGICTTVVPCVILLYCDSSVETLESCQKKQSYINKRIRLCSGYCIYVYLFCNSFLLFQRFYPYTGIRYSFLLYFKQKEMEIESKNTLFGNYLNLLKTQIKIYSPSKILIYLNCFNYVDFYFWSNI